jgi:hypothetical protein
MRSQAANALIAGEMLGLFRTRGEYRRRLISDKYITTSQSRKVEREISTTLCLSAHHAIRKGSVRCAKETGELLDSGRMFLDHFVDNRFQD